MQRRVEVRHLLHQFFSIWIAKLSLRFSGNSLPRLRHNFERYHKFRIRDAGSRLRSETP